MSRQAILVYQTPDGREEEQPLALNRESSIGRHPHCTVTVSQPSVSRKHARLEWDGQSCVVEDLNSSNGTYVNNQRITRSALRDGDELRCGDFRLRYVEREAAGAAPDPKPAPLKVVGKLRPPTNPQGSNLGASRKTIQPRRSVTPAGSDLNKAGMTPVRAPIGRASRPPARQEPDDSFLGDPEGRIEQLREEVATWKGLYEKLKASGGGGESEADKQEKVRLEGRLDELRSDVEDRDRRISELESARARAQEQADTQAERAVRLREQVAAQQSQLEEYRQEKVALDVELGEARQRLEQLRSNQALGGQRESELADEINNLKREVRQRDKAIRDIEQRLEVAEYDVQQARKQNEELKFASEDDRAKARKLNEQLDHLRQVLVDKEEMLESTQAEEERWRQRAEYAEERAREAGGAQAAQLSEALDAERAAHGEAVRNAEALARKITDLERQLAEAAKGAGSSRRLMEQINELKRENRDLRNQAEAAAAHEGDAARLADLERRLEDAERERHEAERTRVRVEGELRQVRVALERAQGGGGGGGGGGGDLMPKAIDIYEALNDLAADLRTNVDLSGGMIRDLRPIIDSAEALRQGTDTAAAVNVIRRTADEVDAALTMESAEEAVSRAEESARTFRRQMRAFRELLQAHGYGN